MLHSDTSISIKAGDTLRSNRFRLNFEWTCAAVESGGRQEMEGAEDTDHDKLFWTNQEFFAPA